MNASVDEDIRATFLAAEHEGIKLALKGRFVAIGVLTLLYAFTRSGRLTEVLLVGAALALIGLIHFRLAGSRYDRPWVKYIFITLDIVLLTGAIIATPEVERLGLPPSIIFRYDLLPFYFLVLTVAAFSFSPGLVMWTGFAGAAAWVSAFEWATSQMERRLDWGDVPRDQGAQAYLDVFLSPDFAPSGSRMQEGIILIIAAALLAIVMRRARHTVFLHLRADSDRKTITSVFGRYVPEAVVDAVVAERGTLAPVHREATVLFVDLAGFTSLTERLGPEGIVDVLNEYFDAVTQVIASHRGVVTQFQGDAVLATFNVPIVDAQHAEQAVHAAKEIIALVASRPFAGEQLRVRVGVNTGLLVAGNVGGGGRQTYTVHGDAVNLAARLEAMNKELATSLLLSESTAALLGEMPLNKVASVEVRGLKGERPVYTLAGLQ